jgi:hypothetical protein
MSIFSDMIEQIMEVFMDDFSVYGKTFPKCLILIEFLEGVPRSILSSTEKNAISW